VLTWCDERAWYDMGAYVAGRRETCSWRVCDGCRREYAAGARSQVNMSRWVRQGSSRGHKERYLSGTFMCGRSECNATASNVPDGEGNYQRGAGAFLSGLMRDWGYSNVKGLIWDRYEVPECSPWMEGANCSCWSTCAGGSNEQSQQVVSEIKYSKKEYNFKQ